MKKVLVDINHPAHVHLFKNFIQELNSRGHVVIITAKNVDSITKLLTLYNIPYISTGRKKDHIFWKYVYEFFHLLKVLGIVISRRIDYGIGISMVLPIVSKLTAMKSFALDDDDLVATPIFGKFTSYADVILNPGALAHEDRGEQRICHPSYHELAYLHPNRFRPDPGVLTELGMTPGDPFFVLRFNAFKAHHDGGARGLSLDHKVELVQFLKKFGRIFITTERDIEPELKPYQLPVSPEKIHNLLYYATLFVGDSQTMTTEAALLGTPAIKLNTFAGQLSIPNEIELNYQLCYSFQPEGFPAMMHKLKELVLHDDIKTVWRNRKAIMLADKADLTTFLTDLVLNYPNSVAEAQKAVVHK